MTWVHHFVPNWGLAIVITTLLLRTFMLLFTIPQTRWPDGCRKSRRR